MSSARIAVALVLCTTSAACAPARTPPRTSVPVPAPAPRPASTSTSTSTSTIDAAWVAREKEAMEALRRSGRRVGFLEPSGAIRGRGRFPASWRSNDAILLRLDETPTDYDGDLTPGVSIAWSSRGNDGHIYVILTDEQLWVQSGHDNPHANHLYWLAPASAAQRAAVVRALVDRNVRRTIECGAEDGSRAPHAASVAEDCFFRAARQERTAFGDDHLAVTASNIASVLRTLNAALPKDVAPLPVPHVGDLEQRVIVSASADELSGTFPAR